MQFMFSTVQPPPSPGGAPTSTHSFGGSFGFAVASKFDLIHEVCTQCDKYEKEEVLISAGMQGEHDISVV